MDDLISRKRIMDEAKRLSGPITGDGWDNWGVYALIERQPSAPAVPLDKLCELLAENSIIPCEYCQYFSNRHCTAGIGATSKPCPNSVDSWRNTITKWMEGLDAEVH